MKILETDRLILREIDSAVDAEFVLKLLNSPKFIQYIGDRGVRSAAEAAEFIETRYRQSYRDHGYGLYTVERKTNGLAVGICGFVRRETLPGPDIGFAFLPEYEGNGYGSEAVRAALDHGRRHLGFPSVYAITTLDNMVSVNLLAKLGFVDEGTAQIEDGETLRIFKKDL